MSRRLRGLIEFPGNKDFKFRHGIAWLFYLWILKWNLEALWAAKQSGAVYLLPAILLAWVAVFTATVFIEHWLDGANRYALFRFAMIVSSALSCILGLWMLWHYAAFLLVGLVTMFQRPMELFSLTAFGTRFVAVCLAVATFALFAWLSFRVVLVLLSGERQANFEQVLGEESFGGPDQPLAKEAPMSLPPQMAEPKGVDTGIAIRRNSDPRILSPENNFRRAFVGPSKPPEKPGKQRYLQRPLALYPKLSLNYQTYGPPILQDLAFRRNIDKEKVEMCKAMGWAAFEWVLRTEPSLPEVMYALEALPNLAPAVDDADAREARDWISRLADHPGSLEVDIHWRDASDGFERTRTVRIADVALQTLIDWDTERTTVR